MIDPAVMQRSWSSLGVAAVLVLAARTGDAQEAPLSAGPGAYRTEADTFLAHVHPDGSVTFADRRNLRVRGLVMTFDITDALMRSRGMDPYATAKLRFLDQTRDARVRMRQQYRDWQLAQSADLMRANIERVWATVPDLEARKQALFELWDECAESGDPALVAAGEAARAVVIDFARTELTGEAAYTQAELDRFNARRTSVARFEPYGPRAPDERIAARSRSLGVP